MKKVYLSSTLKDLKEYREEVAKALEQIKYEVVRMEEYVARDKQTRAGCEEDVAECDIYVGVFAWRYGFVPGDNNPEGRSITELEYRRAATGKQTCLIFLVRDEAEWPKEFRDSETGEGDRGERVRALREELQGHSPGYFSTKHELAKEVIAALHQLESTRRVEQLKIAEEVQKSAQFGASYLPNIESKMVEAMQGIELVEFSLGPTPWWDSRLYLVAALARDFTEIRQFVFLDGDGDFVLMTTPDEICRTFSRRSPKFKQVYEASCPDLSVNGAAAQIKHIVLHYSMEFYNVFKQSELDANTVVGKKMLKEELGIKPSAEPLEQSGSLLLQNRDIVLKQTPFVALLAKGKLVSIIDRLRMASRIATQMLEEQIG